MNPIFTARADRSNPANFKVSIDALPPEAWQKLGGDSAGSKGGELWREVPWLYRGVNVVSTALSDLPFTFTRGGEVISSSANYEDPTGGALPSPREFFGLTATALQVYGRAYWWMPPNVFQGVALVRWLAPTSVEPVFDERGGDLLRFDRRTDTGTDPVPTDDVLYIWQHDPDVEIGPPKSSAVEAAIMAATAARSTDSYVDTFFKRGAIKPSVFLMKGNIAPAEREKVRSWWRRLFRGSKSAWGENILNADTFDVKQVGEGLESLENGALTDKLREDIATALGVPHSILFSNAANFAVAEQDFRNLYTLTVAPLAAHMADVMNEQLFSRFNVTLEFNHDQMDIFQEDEEDRTASLINLLNAWASSDPDLTVTGMQMLGMELPAGVEWDEFRAALAGAREAQPPAAAENIPTATGTQPTNEETRALTDGFREIDDGRSLLRADLDKWFRKSLKRFRAGKGAAVNFESDHIDAPSAMLIHEFLSAAESSGDIARVFDVSV